MNYAIISDFEDDSFTINVFESIASDLGTYLALILVACPILLIIMNYVKALDKYKPVLAVALPAIALLTEILVFFIIKKNINHEFLALEEDYSYFNYSIESSTVPKFGFFLMIISYIATAIAGLITYHGLTLDKTGLENVKSQGMNIINKAATKITEATETNNSEPENESTASDQTASDKTTSDQTTEE